MIQWYDKTREMKMRVGDQLTAIETDGGKYMAKIAAVKNQDNFTETCSSIISGVITFFLMLLVSVFPLIYHNSYFDILETKYQCFYMLVLGMAAVILVLSLIMLVVDFNEFKGEHAKALFSSLAPKNWKSTFHPADIAVLVFWVVCLISTLQSEYMFEAFWGNEGRYSGLFLITIYVLFYFLISRCWKVRRWVLQLFLLSGLIMCYIGITDYFQMDVLNFRGGMKPEQSTIFTSTVGNINTYTAYVSLLMGFSAGEFLSAKGIWKSLWYYVCLNVAFVAIVMGCSDNAYLAIGVMFAFLPFAAFGSRRGGLRYLLMISGFTSVIQCIDMINQKCADTVIGLDSLFQLLVNFRWLALVVIGFWVITVAYYIFVYRGKSERDALGNRWKRIWAAGLAFVVLAVIFALLDANILGHETRYGDLGRYLVFNDSWGTNRGYIWRKSFELYRDFPILHKLFGYGPDTFGIMTTQAFKFEMIDATGQVFDSAHNEYLQFLLTIGPIGLAAYLTFQISSVRRMLKKNIGAPCALGCACAIVCYGFQALVNLNLPIATPMMWFLLSVGVATRGNKANGVTKL